MFVESNWFVRIGVGAKEGSETTKRKTGKTKKEEAFRAVVDIASAREMVFFHHRANQSAPTTRHANKEQREDTDAVRRRRGAACHREQ